MPAPSYGNGAGWPLRGKLVGWDTETSLIQPGLLAPPLASLQLSGPGEPPPWLSELPNTLLWEYTEPEVYWSALVGVEYAGVAMLALLEDPDVVLVAHNAAYDVAVMLAEFPWLTETFLGVVDAGRSLDTRIRETLLSIAQGRLQFDPRLQRKGPRYSLAELVLVYFDVDISESKTSPNSWRLRFGELRDVPVADWPDEAVAYAVSDASWAWQVAREQAVRRVGPPEASFLVTLRTSEGDITTLDGGVLDEIPQCRAALSLHLMAVWGIRVDAEAVEELSAALLAEAQEGIRVGVEAGFLRDTGSRNMALLTARVTAAYERLGKDCPKTPGGGVSTASDTLLNSGDDALVAYAQSAFARKQLETFIPMLRAAVEAGAPITSSPDVLKETGRTSWAKPNLQQLPRAGKVRECFVPREGWVMCSIDYDMAELCALAQIWLWWYGTSTLGDAINEGLDPHVAFGAELEGVDYAELAKGLKSSDPTVKAWAKNARQFAKVGNFGIPGGLGAGTLAEFARTTYGLEMSETAARRLIDTWKRKWKESAKYFDRISRKGGTSGVFTAVQEVSGRHRQIDRYAQGCNTYFQGLVADGAKAALWDLTLAMYLAPPEGSSEGRRALYGCRSVVFIHDEVILEGPEDTAHLWAPEAARLMVAAMRRYIPDIKIGASPALMRRWYKGAETVLDEEGRLIPWEPPK